jgi:hypothetical protein
MASICADDASGTTGDGKVGVANGGDLVDAEAQRDGVHLLVEAVENGDRLAGGVHRGERRVADNVGEEACDRVVALDERAPRHAGLELRGGVARHDAVEQLVRVALLAGEANVVVENGQHHHQHWQEHVDCKDRCAQMALELLRRAQREQVLVVRHFAHDGGDNADKETGRREMRTWQDANATAHRRAAQKSHST